MLEAFRRAAELTMQLDAANRQILTDCLAEVESYSLRFEGTTPEDIRAVLEGIAKIGQLIEDAAPQTRAMAIPLLILFRTELWLRLALEDVYDEDERQRLDEQLARCEGETLLIEQAISGELVL